MTSNPLLAPWTTPFEVPPFAEIAPDAFRDAFTQALASDLSDVEAIIADPAEPSFENTIAALERSGRLLDRVAGVFYNLTGADTNDTLKAIEREMSPVLAQHRNRIYLDETLFRRVDRLAQRKAELALDAEQIRVLERYHRIFKRQGAGLPAPAKARLAAISERLAVLGTSFSQNVLADEQSYTLVLGEDDLGGLPDYLVAAGRDAATERGVTGVLITLSRSSIEPFLASSDRRDLREQAFRAWIARGEGGGTTDNLAIVAEMVALRAERAKLLGFPSFAHFRLDDSMAKTPEAALGLLR